MDQHTRKKHGRATHRSRISAPELTLTPDQSYFKVAEWIYSHEEECSRESDRHTPPVAHPRPLTSMQTVRLPTPYLINREASEVRNGKRLIKAMCTNPMAFYYYKQRHLFKPYTHRLHRPSGDLRQPQQRPATTMKLRRPRVAQTSESHRQRREAGTELKGDAFITQLIAKCNEIPPSTYTTFRAQKERETLKQVHKRLDWTQKTLESVSDCEPDLLIPYYLEQRAAFDTLTNDAKIAAEELRRSAVIPSIGQARFERVLRRNKNLIL